ncbi:hypothetical protein NGA_0708100, partial [Nannochloropsis gaditana CCMP526]|uniref:uncharacterized protein n=1 Tax=Nannochloropsis gaditana (strain CCMP526) TaxID=1093141 RepID=UPI00029F7B74
MALRSVLRARHPGERGAGEEEETPAWAEDKLPIAVSPDGLLLCIVTAKRSLALYRLAPPASSSSSSPSSSSLFSSSPSQLHSANGNSASIEEGKISGNPIPSCTGAATASCGEGIRVLDFAAEEVEGEAPPVEVEITALKV